MATDLTADSAQSPPSMPVLQGGMLILAGFVLSMANFMAVLDTSIANVALPHIAGALAASPKEGTSVITFFAVAEAITIPLTGWLAQRFGNVRVFLTSMAAFGVTSALCGLASSLPILIIARVLQGLAAGPMMPLSQALLTQIVPKKHYPMAIGLWTMTVIIAPIVGPVLGGNIANSIGWEWAFYINVPVAIFAVIFGMRLLPPFEIANRQETGRLHGPGAAHHLGLQPADDARFQQYVNVSVAPARLRRIGRDELTGAPKMLDKERWAGAVDTVGSTILANVIAMTRAGGAVAACGNAAGMDLPTSVAPFILRGVSLLGINSVTLPKALREEAWARLVRDLDRGKLKAMTTTIGFDDIRATAEKIVEGKVRGRVVVEIG